MSTQCHICGQVGDLLFLPSKITVCKWCVRAHDLVDFGQSSDSVIVQPAVQLIQPTGPMVRVAESYVATEGFCDHYYRFYKAVFGEEIDFSGVRIPAYSGGFDTALPIVKGMTANYAWQAAKLLFRCYSSVGDNLDKAVPGNERTPVNGTYVIRFRDCVEADEELKNRSANWITGQKLATMTLTERIIFELEYFWNTGGKHLDIQNCTLCSGSRGSGGSIPDADWSDGRFRIGWRCADRSHDGLRARAVVS